MLNLHRESEDCLAFLFCQEQGKCSLQFKSCHLKKIFQSVLHSLLWAYALRQALSSDNLERMSHSWKDYSAMERQNCRGGKAIHPHRADQNPHQRWSLLQRKPALHHPSDRGRNQLFFTSVRSLDIRRNLYTFCWNGLFPEFERDLSKVLPEYAIFNGQAG